ncbi:hypothetical protein E4U16_007797 [Claviceps sp. LM84 group G4]|nr:hypothetical protein E4U33_002811 [Claviceps sp. LM78 group G4]KAG6081108.1 hypothetical protein E4U16_007797 [Claviceps sp. LM84 group G4]
MSPRSDIAVLRLGSSGKCEDSEAVCEGQIRVANGGPGDQLNRVDGSMAALLWWDGRVLRREEA